MSKLTPLFSLGELYVSDFLKPDEEPSHPPVEMKLMLNDDNLVHLEKMAPRETMWGEHYWYRSSINATMRKQLMNVVESIADVFSMKDGDVFLDIASNDGFLLSCVPSKFSNLIKIGCDPANDSFRLECEKYADLVIQDYFSAETFKKSKYGHKKVKCCTTISMFYDISNYDKFIQDIVEVLDDNGLWVVQCSYTPLMIKQMAWDNLCHEHFAYWSLFNLKPVLERNGLQVMDVSLDNTNAGSFRVYCMKQGADITQFGSQTHRDVCNYRINSILTYEKTLKLNEPETWLKFKKDIDALKEKTVSFLKEEVDKGKTIMGYGACHDITTRLVTEDGIKHINEVTIDDKVYSLNIETKEMELVPINEIMRFPYKGELIHFKGKRIDQMVTPNHQVLFETKHHPKLRFEAAEDIAKRGIFYLPKSTWKGKNSSTIDIRKFVNQNDYTYHRRKIQNIFNTEDFLYLLGIFIGDGYICDKKNQGFSINLCIPKKDKARKKVIATLNKMNLSFREYDNELQVASKALCDICQSCERGARNKRIPKWALEYSPKYLTFLLDGLIDSDGWYEGKLRRKKFCSSSFKLIKDVCELSLKLGYFPSIMKRKPKKHPKIKNRVIIAQDAYIINICTNHPASYNQKGVCHSKKVKYEGDVWCLSVKNKNFLVERNGKLCFSGNSTKGMTVLGYFGLDNTTITAIADRSPYKHGLRTIAGNIPIISEDEMRAKQPDYLLVLPFHFIQEFVERESEYLNRGGKMIVLCPKFEIISK